MISGTCPTIKFIYRSSLQIYREQFLCREKGKSREQRAEGIEQREKDKGGRRKGKRSRGEKGK
jgi:hypothetical protein